MIILDAKAVRYPGGWWLALLVDKIPRNSELTWCEYACPGTEDSVMMAVREDGYAQAYQVVPRNQQGFGGAVLSFPMENDVTREVKGPWQTNARVVIGTAAPLVMDVAIVDNPDIFSRDYIAPNSYLTFEKAAAVVANLDGFELVPDEHGVPSLAEVVKKAA